MATNTPEDRRLAGAMLDQLRQLEEERALSKKGYKHQTKGDFATMPHRLDLFAHIPTQRKVTDGLCEYCEMIDFTALVAPSALPEERDNSLRDRYHDLMPPELMAKMPLYDYPTNSTEWYPLGLYDEIKTTTGCSSCRLVSCAIANSLMEPLVEGWFDSEGGRVCCFLSAEMPNKAIAAADGHETPRCPSIYIELENTKVRTSELWYSEKARQENLDQPYRLSFDPEIRLLAEDAADRLSIPNHHLAREIAGYLDLQLARESYDCCVETHGDACKLSWRGKESGTGGVQLQIKPPEGLRVIDVEEMSVVPSPKDVEFVALSYVWGQLADPLKSTLSNYRLLEEKNGLLQYRIPGTIHDAISLVKSLGMRYLWIDALCIIQDDPSHLAQQISAMDRVYSAATLTIVAGSGRDADARIAGLEGMERDCVPKAEPIQGLRWLACPKPFRRAMDQSICGSRAWCYQEWKLSRRILLFTESQVYFSCSEGIFCESIYHEGEVATTDRSSNARSRKWSSYDNVINQLFRDTGNRIDLFAGKPIPRGWNWNIMRSFLHQYTRRHLTNPHDVFNAIQGILNAAQPDFRSALVGGIQIAELLEGMIWQPAKHEIARRIGKRFPYPSWSWLGWIGSVNFMSHCGATYSVVQSWFHRDSENNVTL